MSRKQPATIAVPDVGEGFVTTCGPAHLRAEFPEAGTPEMMSSSDNPYQAPPVPGPARSGGWGPLVRGTGIVFGSALLGGLLGLAIGATLGALAPGYYRSVFAAGSRPDFDPLAVGIGLGLTQGCALGGVAGLMVTGMYYWWLGRRP